MRKKIAFVKYGGLAAGGTERFLQEIAAELIHKGFEIDYFYCDPKISPGSSWIHPPSDEGRRNFLKLAGVNLIEFQLSYKDLSKGDHPWVSSNFFQIFNEKNYEMVWTAKAGPREFPFYLINLPFIEVVTLDAGSDNSINRRHSILISNWQRNSWIEKGGDESTSSILPLPVSEQVSTDDLRSELGISKEEIVVGFHQRVDDAIVSPIPFEAISRLQCKKPLLLIMGGGSKYREIAKNFNLPAIFLPHNSDWLKISKFLKTIDIYTHGRADGETFGTVLAEAMVYEKPIITHYSKTGSNAHVETIANGGLFAYSVSEYTYLLETLIENTSLRTKLGFSGKVFANTTYSSVAFKSNLSNILINLGLLKRSNKKIENSIFKPQAPRTIPNTRILIHGLSDSFERQMYLKGHQVQAVTRILRQLNLEKPVSMCAVGLDNLLMAIELGRSLPKSHVVFHRSASISGDEIHHLIEINQIFESTICDTSEEGDNSKHSLILDFRTDINQVKSVSPNSTGHLRCKENIEKGASFYLLLPIISTGKFRIHVSRIVILGKANRVFLLLIRALLANIVFWKRFILTMLKLAVQNTKLYRRSIHVRFLVSNWLKVKNN